MCTAIGFDELGGSKDAATTPNQSPWEEAVLHGERAIPASLQPVEWRGV